MTGPAAVTVVIPARNEAASVGQVVSGARAVLDAYPEARVIVVDDGSSDATAARAAEAGAEVLTVRTRHGYGAAVKRGLLAATSPVIVLLDADETYPVEAIPPLVEAVIAGADQAVGSRVLPGANVPAVRRPVKWAIRRLASLLAGARIPDLNSGMRAFRRDRILPLLRFFPDGFSFSTTLTMVALFERWDVAWVPIPYRRRAGRSKFRPVRDTLRLILALLRAVVHFDPLRLFLPLAIGLLALAAMTIVWNVVVEVSLTDSAVLLALSGLEIFVLGLLAELIVRRTGR
jgi:glycosyltransferase involved in cell wall biosynthesis